MDINTTTYSFTLGYPGKKDKGTMYHSSHYFEEETILDSVPPNGFLGLYFNLNNEMQYEINGPPIHGIGRNQYNMVYMHESSCELTFQKGSYASFYMECSIPYLNLMIDHFPLLKTFMERTDRDISSRMNQDNLFITPHINALINDVVHSKYTALIGDVYLKAKFLDIIICCLEHSERHLYIGLNKEEIEKIKRVHGILIKNIQAQHAVNQIADEIGIDQRKLEKGFKVMFGTTVYHFLVNQRMEKAIALMRDTKLTISKIASAVGYPTARIFSDIFKRKFGYPPTALRRAAGEF
jgi:AraC-like DNA-binding protein